MLDSPLMLRLQQRPGLWLRVHENGELEQAEGDARTDSVITPLVARAGQDKPLTVLPHRLASALCKRLWSHDLTKPAPWSEAHAVQVFVGAELVVEGYLGVVRSKGGEQDILGVDSDPDGVAERVDLELSARNILTGIEELLASTSSRVDSR